MKLRVMSVLALAMLLAADSPKEDAAAKERAKLKPPKGRVLLRAKAKGEQIYVGVTQGNDLVWTLKGPQAMLFDPDSGAKIGRHYAGPTWAAEDGSKVVGNKKTVKSARAKARGAIPWLLIEAESHAGAGKFSKVTYIQRVDTEGGTAPDRVPTCVGEEVRVKYKATYVFYGD